jgi:hypothetical protein
MSIGMEAMLRKTGCGIEYPKRRASKFYAGAQELETDSEV